MTKIYTRTGDQGETALYGGDRVRKDSLRLEVVGTIDELNTTLGIVLAQLSDWPKQPSEICQLVERLQHQLFDLGAELATPHPDKQGTQTVSAAQIAEMEAVIDQQEELLEPLRAFILPGGCLAAAHLHSARAVCRRAERLVVSLAAETSIRDEVLGYINRLSDLLFVLARAVNLEGGVPDVLWRRG